uniref:NADH-ubiquinone oxidoreductase chain 3 n=1 Tax=Trypophloeus asperatus TaxID=1897477 RepID=A0A343A6C5_9CUCU|nr:NADH dehydrogenase subunit 3 [Trypophloeus asperatus]AOY40104.1 NADH dehydrogenase subunit 3 [Trypophloeus asperatus]
MYFLSLMLFMICMIMMIILNLLTKKTFYDREKFSPFECGFDPKNYARLPFSLHFFLIAIIFVLFDVELTLFLPMVLSLEISNTSQISTTMIFFVLILLFGLFHELNQGSLNWVN